MAFNGSIVLLSIETATDTFTVLPCQTTGSYDLSIETRDTSCKDSGEATNSPGRRSRSLSVEYYPAAWPELAASPSGIEEIVRDAAESGTQVTGRIVVSGTALEEFTATISSYSINFPDQETASVSIELAISGALTPVGS